MYIKKLLKTHLTVGTLVGTALMLLCIITVFRFITYQDAKQEIDEMIKDHGVLTAEDKGKIDLFQPALLMMIGGAFGFGAAMYSQMYMTSVQMSVTRKHLGIANIISEVLFTLMITGIFLVGQIFTGLLFSELSKDKYEFLSEKFRDTMFDLSLSGKSTSGLGQNLPAVLLLVFLGSILGTLLVQVLARYRGGKLALALVLPIGLTGTACSVFSFFRLKLAAMFAVPVLIVLMLIAQWRMTKSHTVELMTVKAVH